MMHVQNRVNRALMLANDSAIEYGLYENRTEEEKTQTLETTAMMFLLAELINALQGLDYKGEEVKTGD